MISRKEAISIGASAAIGMLFPTAAFAGNGNGVQKQDGSCGAMAPCYPASGTECLYLDPKYLDVDIQGMSIQEVIDLFECTPNEIDFYPNKFALYTFAVSATGNYDGIVGAYGVMCKDFIVLEKPSVQTFDVQVEDVQDKSEPTLSQQNALRQAKNYTELLDFSRDGLIYQLEFDGYSHEDAVYAVDNVDVDWCQEAANKAKSYLDFFAFSRDGLYEQLDFDGYTVEEIEYALSAVGY